MNKYEATINGSRVLSVYADDAQTAIAEIERQLKRPGRSPIYAQWVCAGCQFHRVAEE